jgi:ATP-dependent RNA helicase RhlE
VEFIEGFGPEPGEKAEPIAMGRQTLWGGAGKPPSREVMAAAAKAARAEMMQRIRENKAPRGGAANKGGKNPRNGTAAEGDAATEDGAARSSIPRTETSRATGAGNGNRPPRPGRRGNGPRPPEARSPAPHDDDQSEFAPDELPRHIDPLRTSLHASRSSAHRGGGNGGQPDPMRTSIDSMAGGGRNRRSGGRGGFGGGGGGNRSRSGAPRGLGR